MATYAKYILSGSSGGGPVSILATGLVGTTVHTAPTGTTGMDEVWVWLNNSATTDRYIVTTIGTGSTASDQKPISSFIVPALDGGYQVVPGIPINNGNIVRCYATATDGAVAAYGYVNRIAT